MRTRYKDRGDELDKRLKAFIRGMQDHDDAAIAEAGPERICKLAEYRGNELVETITRDRFLNRPHADDVLKLRALAAVGASSAFRGGTALPWLKSYLTDFSSDLEYMVVGEPNAAIYLDAFVDIDLLTGGDATVSLLTEVLTEAPDRRGWRKVHAIVGFTRIPKTEAAVDALIEALDDTDWPYSEPARTVFPRVRSWAAMALLQIGDPRGLSAILERMAGLGEGPGKHGTWLGLYVSPSQMSALGWTEQTSPLPYTHCPGDVLSRVWQGLKLSSLEKQERLDPIQIWLDPDREPKDFPTYVIYGLGHYGDDRVIPVLLRLIERPARKGYRFWYEGKDLVGRELRRLLALKLKQGHRHELEPVIRALTHEEPEMRVWAARLLGELAATEATEPLQSMAANDEKRSVRKEAKSALKVLSAKPDKAIDELVGFAPCAHSHLID